MSLSCSCDGDGLRCVVPAPTGVASCSTCQRRSISTSGPPTAHSGTYPAEPVPAASCHSRVPGGMLSGYRTTPSTLKSLQKDDPTPSLPVAH
ncbi:hypothetical protein BT67DRAFT_442583 [Trichocladium antarcticum]|uniref:Uncharacterized protein n=1 Tax=Trichocladium antarcticum TaxID=1450529 RepID=A0AAN6UIV9_9PEZI|nr:hypothetical protein BT67DRAFT_442583 [Trichocladium antarcticum]